MPKNEPFELNFHYDREYDKNRVTASENINGIEKYIDFYKISEEYQDLLH
jgi:hypothetical protein